ncbi:unnamed protein product, partial [Ixodes hexagonus]
MNDAFWICDLREVKSKVKLWRQELPQVTPFFGKKMIIVFDAFYLPFLSLLQMELKAVLDMGVTPDRIIYASPVKCTSHLKFASEHGVTLMAFDSSEELDKIKDENTRLLLRVETGDVTNKVSTLAKFGTPADEVEGLLHLALRMGRKVVGILFHVESARHDPDTFSLAIKQARAAFDIGTRLGFPMTVLSIGGGFLGGTRKQDSFLKVLE